MPLSLVRSCIWLLASSLVVLAAEADDGHKRIHVRLPILLITTVFAKLM